MDKYNEFAEEYLKRGLSSPSLDMMSKLMKFRMESKDKDPTKYACIKGIVNASYGVFASPNFRVFIPEIAAKITETAREGLKFVISSVENKGYTILAADTDSIMIEINKDKVPALVDWLNNELKSIGDYEIKFEKYFIKYCCLGAKKRYFGEIEGRDSLEVKGFEDIRSDASKLTKTVQEKIMRFVLDKDRQGAVDYLKSVSANFANYSYDDIAIPKGLSMDLDAYKTEVDYVRGAKWVKTKYNVNMGAGDRVWYVYAYAPASTITVPDIEMFDKIQGLKVDREKMLNRIVTMPTEDLIAMLDISWTEIKGQGRLL